MPRNSAPYSWLAILGVLILLAYAIPYTALTSVERVAGAFSFWTIFGAVAVALIIFAVSRWKV